MHLNFLSLFYIYYNIPIPLSLYEQLLVVAPRNAIKIDIKKRKSSFNFPWKGTTFSDAKIEDIIYKHSIFRLGNPARVGGCYKILFLYLKKLKSYYKNLILTYRKFIVSFFFACFQSYSSSFCYLFYVLNRQYMFKDLV